MLLGGTVALGVAVVFFMGEGLRAVACVCARNLLKAVCRVQGVAVECKCVSILRRPTGGRTGRECSGELRASVVLPTWLVLSSATPGHIPVPCTD